METEVRQAAIEVIPFHSDYVYCIVVDDVPYVIISPIMEAIGLNLRNGIRIINRRSSLKKRLAYFKFSTNRGTEMGCSFEKDGIKTTYFIKKTAVSAVHFDQIKGYRYMGLPVSKYPSWINSIQINKVKPEVRPVLESYQEECDEALFVHFMKKHFQQNKHITVLAETKTNLPLLKKALHATKEWKDYEAEDNRRLNAERALTIIKNESVSKQTRFDF